jgi:hypothetical protein
MGYSNGIVTKPVTTKDIGQAIGSSSRKVGVLCTDSNINKWARYKPVKYKTYSPITEEERKKVKYGFSIPFVNTSSIGSNMAWIYQRPEGYPNSPFRMRDFDGYYHDSTPSIEIGIPDKAYLNKADSNNYVIIAFDDYATSWKEGNIEMLDLFSYGNEVSWFPGLLVVHPTKGTIWKTTKKTLAEWFPPEDLTIPVRDTWLAGEQVDVYAILSQYSFTGAPTETPPIEVNSMYYLEYEEGKGHKRVLLETYNFIAQYISVTTLNIEYQKNLVSGSYVYEIYYMTGTVKNEYGGQLQFTMSIEISDEETGDVYEYGSKVQIVQGLSSAAFMVDPGTNLLLPTYNAIWEISIRGVQTVGNAGNIFTRKFNFETGQWL